MTGSFSFGRVVVACHKIEEHDFIVPGFAGGRLPPVEERSDFRQFRPDLFKGGCFGVLMGTAFFQVFFGTRDRVFLFI